MGMNREVEARVVIVSRTFLSPLAVATSSLSFFGVGAVNNDE